MRAVLLVLIGLGLAWAFPKLKRQYQAHKTIPIVDTGKKVDGRPVVGINFIKPPGPGDAWLPKVKQLEKQLEQFKNPSPKSQN